MRLPSYACLLLFLCVSLLTSCASGKLYIKDPQRPQTIVSAIPDYTIYAVGDAGELNQQSRSVMASLSELANDDTHPGTVLFLGDNIYPAGFPPESDITGSQYARDVMMNQIAGLSSFKGQLIFIPGNHDWNEFKTGGLESIKRQGDFLRQLKDSRIRMVPQNGCGGPVPIELNDNVVMIILDSQWWIHDWTIEKEMNAGCKIETREEFIKAFHQTVQANKGKQIVVTLHHPLYTQGAHGGHFTIRDHLFPLTKVVKWLYLPLPVIGSIYPYYRSIFGHPQDVQHKNYRAMRDALLDELDDKEEIIFLAGHDHNLQYITKGNDHHLLSGSGSKQNPIANAKHLVYGHQAAGYMQVDFYKKEGVRLTVFEVNPESGVSKVVFSRFILGEMSK